jgi:hypothetical protein
MHAHIRTHIERLQREAKEDQRIRQDVRSLAKSNTLRPVKPLDVQITELMASLPPVQRDRKWSMTELVARLEGRYRDRPHPQMIGAALRTLGWSTVRDYSNSGGGRRYWLKDLTDNSNLLEMMTNKKL